MAGLSFIVWIFIVIVSFCIAIASLLIWRNTNRTNRLLALLLVQNGTEPNLISKAYYGTGSDIEYLNVQSYSNDQENSATMPVQGTSANNDDSGRTKVCPACGTVCSANATKCRICPREF